MIEGVEQVVLIGECIRQGVGSDVDVLGGREVGAFKVEDIVEDLVVLAGGEGEVAMVGGFLKNAKQPVVRADKSIVSHDAVEGADKGDGCIGAFNDIREDADVLGFEVVGAGRERGAEEWIASAATNIESSGARFNEFAATDFNVFAASFYLDCGGAASLNATACDDASVAADHINRAAAVAGVNEAAINNEEVISSGEFQAILIAAAANIVNVQVAELNEAARFRVVDVAAVVAVETILSRVLNLQVMNDKIATS